MNRDQTPPYCTETVTSQLCSLANDSYVKVVKIICRLMSGIERAQMLVASLIVFVFLTPWIICGKFCIYDRNNFFLHRKEEKDRMFSSFFVINLSLFLYCFGDFNFLIAKVLKIMNFYVYIESVLSFSSIFKTNSLLFVGVFVYYVCTLAKPISTY